MLPAETIAGVQKFFGEMLVHKQAVPVTDLAKLVLVEVAFKMQMPTLYRFEEIRKEDAVKQALLSFIKENEPSESMMAFGFVFVNVYADGHTESFTEKLLEYM